MIFGIGVDLVQTGRMATSLDRFGKRIAEKVLTQREMMEFQGHSSQASFLAKRFAAKEALAKALGTGFRQKLSMSLAASIPISQPAATESMMHRANPVWFAVPGHASFSINTVSLPSI